MESRSFTTSGSSMASSSSWAPAQCCDTKITYTASGYPDAFYLKVSETDTDITGQCPGGCVYVRYVYSKTLEFPIIWFLFIE